ncbi:MAG: hypothetical protein IJ167_00465 [Lachnospiraceae bacterium]|nr:hypothetical protein [Lachnospiraceae bacterium]
MLESIITEELISNINGFFNKYHINKSCDDIWNDIIVISKSQLKQYDFLEGMSGKYDIQAKKIILIDTKLTQRLFLHEYIHKKSVKRRLFRKDLLGICYNKHLCFFNEAITEKITCEILSIPYEEQILHPYSSMFIAIDKLMELIEWNTIVNAYFTNDITIFKNVFSKRDFRSYLMNISVMYEVYRSLLQGDSKAALAYNTAYNIIVKIIDGYTK